MKRLEKLNELIKEELSKIIFRELELPPGAMATITRVETSDNKLFCRVFISVFETKELNEERLLKDISRLTPKIQRMFNKRLRIRPVPKIKFVPDALEKKRERIEKLLTGLDKGSTTHNQNSL